MDTKWKKFSYSTTVKIIAFVIAVLCFAGTITILVNAVEVHNADFGVALEDSYYLSRDFFHDSQDIIYSIQVITVRYKSEENILSGGTIEEDDLSNEEDRLFNEFRFKSKSYNPNLSDAENYMIFKEVFADEIAGIRDDLIQADLDNYQEILRRLQKYHGIIYYCKKGDSQFANSPNPAKEHFLSFPCYIILEGYEQNVFPAEIKDNAHFYNIVNSFFRTEPQGISYLAFSEEFLNPRIAAWQDNKQLVTDSLYQIAGLFLGLILVLVYLLLVIGRKANGGREIHFNFFNKLYNDFNIGLIIMLGIIWLFTMDELNLFRNYQRTFAVTLIISAVGLMLVLSLVKHFKNGTLIKHSLIYTVLHKLFAFVKDVYNNGSLAVKIVLVVVGYPVLTVLTFFMFPVTLGVAAWLALKRVKEFNAIKQGVKQVKEGDINHIIDINGDGEFAQLASDINSITDGLNKAVENGVKSERLKSELITNVSHDIRTPLTSIITYVDLLKKEKDPMKTEDYIEVIDQKAQRLKILTDDLFEAAKASSGNVPVCFEDIELVSLLTQGLGELDGKIQERRLVFKMSNSKDKVYVRADGKLLWRAIENLLSNILKYALEGSRVYIDIIDLGAEVQMIIKNISANELNITSAELMERFKRGDESRSSEGSGLGLSIAKSLIEIQKGSFDIEIDGDLFKAIIQLPKRLET